MTEHSLPAGTRIVVLTDNMLEAADFTEYFDQYGVTEVVALRKPDTALQLLAPNAVSPELVVFGYRLSEPDATSCLGLVVGKGWPVLLVNGSVKPSQFEQLPTLVRPFTTQDLDRALREMANSWKSRKAGA